MKRTVAAVVAFASMGFLASVLSQAALAAEPNGDRVIAMYFHRTQRCPTCRKMGSYSEEAVTSRFAQQIEAGKVQFHYIDFQDQKNAAVSQGYKVAGPTLIVARINGNKVVEYKNLTEIWAKVRDKDAFVEYVQSNVRQYLQ